MSENTENAEQSDTPENLQSVEKKPVQGALASWETPHMSFQERLQKHGKQMVARLYGPAGSVVFHIVAIAVLVTFAATKGNVVVETEPVVIEAPKAPELDKTEVKPEKIEQQNNEEVSDTPDSLGVYLTWSPRPGRTDAERNCISNVRPEGLSASAAAELLVLLMNASRAKRISGVGLKAVKNILTRR